jgi:enoyl-CoA hydratase/carnithine racemase
MHLRSAQASFCGGADPQRLRAWHGDAAGDAIAADAARWSALFDRIATSPVVVLAEIGGPALGAGLGLALACDLRMAATSAVFGVPEARFGLLPAGGTMARLALVAGLAVAQRTLLAAQTLDAAEALSHGIVQWVVKPEELAAKAAALAGRVSLLSPLALAEAKAVLATEPATRIAREDTALRRLVASAPDRARVAALFERLSASPGTANA